MTQTIFASCGHNLTVSATGTGRLRMSLAGVSGGSVRGEAVKIIAFAYHGGFTQALTRTTQ